MARIHAWRRYARFFGVDVRSDVDDELRFHLEEKTRDLIATVGDAAHIDGAFDKILWRLHDQRFPLRLLPPYQAASAECFERFRTLVVNRYPRWTPDQ